MCGMGERSSVNWSVPYAELLDAYNALTPLTLSRCFDCFSFLSTLTDKIIDNNIANGRCGNYHIRFSKYDWLVV